MSTSPTPRTRIALVHATDGHGVSRYADRLAGFLEARSDLEVRHVPARRSVRSLPREVRAWLGADVVHVQWSPLYWGETWSAVARALALAAVGTARPVLVTMHDVHHERARPDTGRPPSTTDDKRRPGLLTRTRRRLRLMAAPRNIAQVIVSRSAHDVLVFSDEEAEVLARRRRRQVTVLPHFIEGWVQPASAVEEDQLVVFGFIHPRKGQLLAVEALPVLSGLRLVLCGATEPRHTDYLQKILERAAELGVQDRVVVTGHVSDEELVSVLGRSRLALCPYQRIAASGSLSTLIAHGVPVVAHSTAYTRRLAAEAPGSIALFAPWDASALAEAVTAALRDDGAGARAGLRTLAQAHGPAVTAHRHAARYTEASKRWSAR